MLQKNATAHVHTQGFFHIRCIQIVGSNLDIGRPRNRRYVNSHCEHVMGHHIKSVKFFLQNSYLSVIQCVVFKYILPDCKKVGTSWLFHKIQSIAYIILLCRYIIVSVVVEEGSSVSRLNIIIGMITDKNILHA